MRSSVFTLFSPVVRGKKVIYSYMYIFPSLSETITDAAVFFSVLERKFSLVKKKKKEKKIT